MPLRFSDQRSIFRKTPVYATLTLLVLLPFALGGAHPTVNSAAVLGLAVLFVGTQWRRLRRPLLKYYPALLPIGTAWAMTALQLVALPEGLLRRISPKTHEILDVSLGPHYGWAPLTLDIPATVHELVKITLYVLLLFISAHAFSKTHRLVVLFQTLALTGAGVTLLGFAHWLLGIDRPYDYFGYASGVLTASFINPNHLAAYLGFASFVALALIFFQPEQRFIWAGCAGFSMLGMTLTLSRGAIASYLLVVVCLAILWTKHQPQTRHLLWALVGAACVTSAAIFLAYQSLLREFWSTGAAWQEKAFIWPVVQQLWRDFPLGVGRGAMGMVVPHYMDTPLQATFYYAENEYIQALADWGVAPGIFFFGTVLWFAWNLWQRARSNIRYWFLLGAGAFLALHNFVDFNLSLTAIAASLTAVTAAISYTGDNESVHVAQSQRRLLWAPPISILLVVGVGILGWLAINQSLSRSTTAARAMITNRSSAEDITRSFSLMRRYHPSDFVLPLLQTQGYLQANAPRLALRSVNDALFLAPTHYAAHHLTGQALLLLGQRQQAALEYGLAIRLNPYGATRLTQELWQKTQDISLLQKLAEHAQSVAKIARAFDKPKDAAAALAVLGEQKTTDAEVSELQALTYWNLGKFDNVIDFAQRAQTLDAKRSQPYILESQALMQKGHSDAALEALQRGMKNTTEVDLFLYRRALLLTDQRRFDDARADSKKLLERSTTAKNVAVAHWVLGRLYEKEDRAALALREYEKARDADHSNIDYVLSLVTLKEAMGDISGARAEFAKLENELTDNTRFHQAKQAFEERHR